MDGKKKDPPEEEAEKKKRKTRRGTRGKGCRINYERDKDLTKDKQDEDGRDLVEEQLDKAGGTNSTTLGEEKNPLASLASR